MNITRTTISRYEEGGTLLQNSYGNCKLSIVEQASSLLSNNKYSTDKKLTSMKNILSHGELTVFFHITNKSILDFLMKHYEIIYSIQIPIGYSNGYQWHVLIKNPYDRADRQDDYDTSTTEVLYPKESDVKEVEKEESIFK